MTGPTRSAGQTASAVTRTESASRTEAASETLLDRILQVGAVAKPTGRTEPSLAPEVAGPDSQLDQFFAAETVGEALDRWLGDDWSHRGVVADAEQIARRLLADIAQIDALLNEQVNAILHHSRFQKLEATWRGLDYLVGRVDKEGDRMIKVKFLNVSWREIERDFERAIEFDQSQLFKKIYEQEIGMPGGEPFGLLVGDYAIRHKMSPEHPHDDVAILTAMAGVAAAAFCPFLCAADPRLLELDGFADLQSTRDHARRFGQLDYLRWNALRDSEDARFLGVVLPKILMRGPYRDDGSRVDGFLFDEDVSTPGGGGHLWGNAAYAYAGVAIRAFATSGWLADIRGLRQDEDGGGLVSDLPALNFPSDRGGAVLRSTTEMTITDRLERELSDLGLIPLCDCKDTPMAVFASGQTLQRPKAYHDAAAQANAKISTMMPYILTCSRFAHYLKVIARDKVGSLQDADDVERHLHDWLMNYVTSDREASAAVKSRRPLQGAQVRVVSDPANPGGYRCVMKLSPHYELDEMAGTVRLTTTLQPR